jgi:hypothetical protein
VFSTLLCEYQFVERFSRLDARGRRNWLLSKRF